MKHSWATSLPSLFLLESENMDHLSSNICSGCRAGVVNCWEKILIARPSCIYTGHSPETHFPSILFLSHPFCYLSYSSSLLSPPPSLPIPHLSISLCTLSPHSSPTHFLSLSLSLSLSLYIYIYIYIFLAK